MIIAFLCAMLWCCNAASTSLRSNCKSKYQGLYFNNKCFVYRSEEHNWEDSMAYCESLGEGIYKSQLMHLLSSEILQLLRLLAGDNIYNWNFQYSTSNVRGCWLGSRDAMSGSDPDQTYWKYRWFLNTTSYVTTPANQMYAVENIKHTGGYDHTDSGLCLKSITGDEMELVVEDKATGLSAACQIVDHESQYEPVGIDIRVTRDPILGTENVKSMTQCLSMCTKHQLCLAVNFFNGATGGALNCELLSWLMVDAGPDHVHYVKGWNYVEISK